MLSNVFREYHPTIIFGYFVFLLGFGSIILHPFCLIAILIPELCYLTLIAKRPHLRSILRFFALMSLLTILLNICFNHRGITILGYFPSGNPFTLESLAYAFASATLLANLCLGFFLLSETLSAEKIVLLFGRPFPRIALMLSMILRFVPLFGTYFAEIRESQSAFFPEQCSKLQRIRLDGAAILALLTRITENAVITADSMKSRGYGIVKRTRYAPDSFTVRDGKLALWLIALGSYLTIGAFCGAWQFHFFPQIGQISFTPYFLSLVLALVLYAVTPIGLMLFKILRRNRRSAAHSSADSNQEVPFPCNIN